MSVVRFKLLEVVRFKLLEVRNTVICHVMLLTSSRKPEHQVKECEVRELLP